MNLLLTGAWSDARSYIPQLFRLGHCVKYLQNENENLPCAYEWVEGVVCNGLFLYHSIENFNNLKYIQLTSAGFDRVPMDYIAEHGIMVYNAHGVYSVPMAEFAICGVLQLYKQARFFYDNQKIHRWEKQRNLIELYEKTVCILGCGNIGTECAKRFKAFGCKILGVDLRIRDDDNYDKILSIDLIDTVLPCSDIVLIALPLTDKTKWLMDKQKFDLMRHGSVFVNLARGLIVKTKDLIEALNSKLLGAVVDVFEDEPLHENNSIWDLKNIIITPHNSFVGDGNKQRLMQIILNNLINSLKG